MPPRVLNIDFPWRYGDNGRTATSEYAAHVRHLIAQVLFTSPGERVNRPSFGSGLQEVVFAPNSETLAAALQMNVQASLQNWLGDLIRVDRLEVEQDDSTLRVALDYSLLRLGQRQSEVFERKVQA